MDLSDKMLFSDVEGYICYYCTTTSNLYDEISIYEINHFEPHKISIYKRILDERSGNIIHQS